MNKKIEANIKNCILSFYTFIESNFTKRQAETPLNQIKDIDENSAIFIQSVLSSIGITVKFEGEKIKSDNTSKGQN